MSAESTHIGRLWPASGFLLLCLGLSVCSAGCGMKQYLASPLRPRCVLPPDISEQQLVAWLNQQTAQVHHWRSTDVWITSSSGGIPVRLSGILAVERPSSFRLKASALGMSAADIGSNHDRFWFWMRQSEPKHVYSVSRDRMEDVRRQMQIPFDPDWLMQVLGVVPLPEGETFLQPREPDSQMLALVIEDFTPAGEPTRRIVQVDPCYGRVISQSLHNSRGQLLARATFNDYRPCGNSGVTLPHQIELDWPQTKTSMTLRMGTIEANGAALPGDLWTMPEIPDYPHMDLGRRVASSVPYGGNQGYIPHGRLPRPGSAAGGTPVSPNGVSRYTQTAAFEEPAWDDEGGTARVRLSSQQQISADRGMPAEPAWDDEPAFEKPATESPQFDQEPAFSDAPEFSNDAPSDDSAAQFAPGEAATGRVQLERRLPRPGVGGGSAPPFPDEPAGRVRIGQPAASPPAPRPSVRPF